MEASWNLVLPQNCYTQFLCALSMLGSWKYNPFILKFECTTYTRILWINFLGLNHTCTTSLAAWVGCWKSNPERTLLYMARNFQEATRSSSNFNNSIISVVEIAWTASHSLSHAWRLNTNGLQCSKVYSMNQVCRTMTMGWNSVAFWEHHLIFEYDGGTGIIVHFKNIMRKRAK